jgi:hypothetical protein
MLNGSKHFKETSGIAQSKTQTSHPRKLQFSKHNKSGNISAWSRAQKCMYLKSIQGDKLHKTLSQIYLLCIHDNYPPHLHLFLQPGISTSFVFKLKGLLSAENTQVTIPTKDNFLLPYSSGISYNSTGGIIDICSVIIFK